MSLEDLKGALGTDTKDAVNAIKIRHIIRENPVLLDGANQVLRVHVYQALLLGEIKTDEYKVIRPGPACREQHVLENDVPRTRADMAEFQQEPFRDCLQNIIQSFCFENDIEYKQGLNEVLAPFIHLLPPITKTEGGEEVTLKSELSNQLFNMLVLRYMERFYCVDSPFFMFQAFRMFHILLVFHDPQLARFLEAHEFFPELYTPQWFLTLYSRAIPMDLVLRVWDMLLAADDPAFAFFVGMSLLFETKDDILIADSGMLPEIVANATLKNHVRDFRGIVNRAWKLYKQTPRCFLRLLRLCFVANSDLNPSPKAIIERRKQMVAENRCRGSSGDGGGNDDDDEYVYSINAALQVSNDGSNPRLVSCALNQQKGQGNGSSTNPVVKLVLNELDINLVQQAARCCLMMSAIELVSILLPGTVQSTSKKSTGNGACNGADARPGAEDQIVLIDLRSQEGVHRSGAGVIPKAIQLEPSFMDHPDAFKAWLEHFDTTRGCRICIIDMPPVRQTEVALWRRLLLGEGDGLDSTAPNHKKEQVGPSAPGGGCSKASTAQADKHRDIHVAGMQREGYASRGMADVEMSTEEGSNIRDLTDMTVEDDSVRSAVRLAKALHAENFPKVSVLEGGYPALVSCLRRKGKLEPVIINHSSADWETYLINTGLAEEEEAKVSIKHQQLQRLQRGKAQNESEVDHTLPRRASDLNNLLKLEYSMKAAERLGHRAFATELLIRHKELKLAVQSGQVPPGGGWGRTGMQDDIDDLIQSTTGYLEGRI